MALISSLRMDLTDQPRRARQIESNSRVPYENGYGDFCFGRLVDREDEEQMNPIFEDTVTTVEHIKVAWAQTRSEPFPFFKLPLEIRRLIYRLIFGPLYLEHLEAFYFRIAPIRENPKLWNFRGDYAWYLMREMRKRKPLPIVDFSSTPPIFRVRPQPPSINPILTHEEYHFEKKRLNDKNESHPHRSARYRLEVQSPGADFNIIKANSGDVYAEWIRQLSNVSTKMRKEIGDAIWLRSHIASLEKEGMWLIPPMLKDRPAIHKSIKSLDLKMSLDLTREARTNLSNFPSWCDYIAEHLELDRLTFTLDFIDSKLTNRNLNTGDLLLLGTCKRIPVKISFEIYLFITNWSFDTTRMPENFLYNKEREYRKTFLPPLKRLMMPKSLVSVDVELELSEDNRSTGEAQD